MDKNIKIKTEDGATLTIKMKDGIDGLPGKDGKDAEIQPIIDIVSSLKNEFKNIPTVNTKNIEKLLQVISDNKQDNSDIVDALNELISILKIEKEGRDYSDKFDALIEATNNMPQLFRPAYNPHDPQIKNSEGNIINPATEETLQSIAGLNIPKHDTRELGYTDGNLTTVVYKLSGDVVATKTLTYTDGNLSSVVIS